MKKLIGALATGAALAFGATAPASAAVVVGFGSAQSHYDVGETFSVSLTVSGLGPEVLSAYDFDVLFDPTVAQWLGASLTGVIPAFGGLGNLGSSISESPGRVELIGYSLLDDATLAASQPDSIEVAVLIFSGLADGTTTFTLGPDLDFERNVVGRDALTLGVSVGTLCISVGTGSCPAVAVPEPASLALVGAALGGLLVPGALRRRRERPGR